MIHYLEENNLLYHRQYGFKKNRSTSDAITNLLGEIIEAFEKDSMILSVFIDLKKAFDSISHEIILKKLKTVGVSGVELAWFTRYLRDRMQCVSVNSCMSDFIEMKTGVPQGALLGVLLFQLQ